MQKVLEHVSDGKVRAYIVWLPMLGSDNREQALIRAAEFTDERVRYFWDGTGLTGSLWQGVLDIPRVAWDIYAIYGTGARWLDEPPVPDFWMHQLGSLEKGAFLDRERFAGVLVQALKASSTSESR